MTIDKNILKNIQNVVENTIITCPHNGPDQPRAVSKIRNKSNLPPEPICKQSQFSIENDSFTSIIATGIADYMEVICGKRPGLFIAKYHRQYIDMNRKRECAYEVQQAKQFYDEYHQSISKHVQNICLKNKGRKIIGHLYDIHGRIADEQTPENIAIGTENGDTIKRLIEINRDALWDETGLIKLLQEQGYTTNPMKKSQKESTRYNGGYTIDNNDCLRAKNGLQRIQLEIDRPYRKEPILRNKLIHHLTWNILIMGFRYLNS
jgi:hypothetical protein